MQPIDTVRATSSSYAATATVRIRQTLCPDRGWLPPLWALPSYDEEKGELTANDLRRLKRQGVAHINLELFDAEGWPLGKPDFSIAELLEAIDPLERGPEETRDGHIGRLLRRWERQAKAHPYAKATAATWDALIVAAFDRSEEGTYFGYGDWKGRACLGQVTRRAKVRGGGGAFRNVCRSYRKSGGWTKSR